jgi:hypothetical protein
MEERSRLNRSMSEQRETTMTGYSRFTGVFLATLLAAGAATAAPKLSPELQKQAIAMRVVQCLSKEAARHDDGVSDPDTIAARIVPLCESDFAREQTAFGAGLSPSSQTEYRHIVERDRATLAAQVVMDERGQRARHRRIAQSQ